MERDDWKIILMAVLFVGLVGLVVGLFVWVLSSSDEDAPDLEGTVIAKAHTSAYTTGFYTGKVFIAQHHPARWKLKLRLPNNSTTWIYVSEEVYGTVSEGDSWPRDPITPSG